FLFQLLVDRFCLFFFFFQAEDGIRDDLVTGVQTCALPIFADEAALGADFGWTPPAPAPSAASSAIPSSAALATLLMAIIWRTVRSEERRVGKECRQWQATYK